MEQTLFIVAIGALGLCFCIFILGIFNNGFKDLFKSKHAKVSIILFIVYVLTFVPYIIISN